MDGQDARNGQFPWTVLVLTEKNRTSYICGGTLICERYVLTAAHCPEKGQNIKVYLGSVDLYPVLPGRVAVDVSKVKYFWRRNTTYDQHDIALLQLSENVTYTDNIQPIPIFRGFVKSDVVVTVMGWGNVGENGLQTDTLQYVNLTSITNDNCKNDYYSGFVRNETLCLQGSGLRNTCNGDSGGPVVRRNANGRYGIVGLIYRGRYCTDGYPSMAVRISPYYHWIKLNVEPQCRINYPWNPDAIL